MVVAAVASLATHGAIATAGPRGSNRDQAQPVPANLAASALADRNNYHSRSSSSLHRHPSANGMSGANVAPLTVASASGASLHSNANQAPSQHAMAGHAQSGGHGRVLSSVASSQAMVADMSGSSDGTVAREVLSVVQRELSSLRHEARELEIDRERLRAGLATEVEVARQSADRIAAASQSERLQITKQIDGLVAGIKRGEEASGAERNALQKELNAVATSAAQREASLTSALASSQSRIESLLRDIAAKDIMASTSGSSVAALQKHLHEALHLQNDETARLKGEIEQLRQALADANSNATVGHEVADQAVQQELQLLRQSNESGRQREAELQSALSSLSAAVESAQAGVDANTYALQQQVQAAQDVSAAASAACLAAVAAAQEEVQAARTERDAARAEANTTRHELVTAASDKDASFTQLRQSLKSAIAESEVLRTSHAEHVQASTATLDQLQRELALLREQLLATHASSSSLEAELRHRVASANETAADAVRARDSRDAASVSELAVIAQKLASSEAAASSHEQELTSIVADLRAALAASEAASARQREADSARARLVAEAHAKDRASLEGRLAASQARIASLEAQVQKVRVDGEANAERLRKQLADELEQHELAVAALRADHATAGDEWRFRLDLQQARVRELEAEIETLASRLESATKLRGRLGLDAVHEYSSHLSASQLGRRSAVANASSPVAPASRMQSPSSRAQNVNAGGESRVGLLPPSPSQILAPNLFSPLPGPDTSVDNGNASDTATSPVRSAGAAEYTDTDVLPAGEGLSIESLRGAASSTADTEAPLLALAQRFGACVLAMTWSHHRSTVSDLQSHLSRSVDALARYVKTSSGPSELVRHQLQLELRGLRTAYDDACRLLEASRQETVDAHEMSSAATEDERRRLTAQETAFATLASALSSSIASVEAQVLSLSSERDAVSLAAAAAVEASSRDLGTLRSALDDLRGSVASQAESCNTTLHLQSTAHMQQLDAVKTTSTAVETSLRASITAAASQASAAKETKLSTESQLQHVTASSSHEINTLRTQTAHAYSLLEQARAAAEGRASDARVRERVLSAELSRLASQASGVDEASESRIQQSRDVFLQHERQRIQALENEIDRMTSTLTSLQAAADANSTSHTAQASSLSNVIGILVRSDSEIIKSTAAGTDAYSSVLAVLQSHADSLVLRSNDHRSQLQHELDSMRARLAGNNKASWSRVAGLLPRVQAILQKAAAAVSSSSGALSGSGGIPPSELAVLQALVDRLRALESSINSTAATSELSRVQSALSAERQEADVREQAYIAEAGRLKAVVDAHRDAAASAAVAVNCAAAHLAGLAPSSLASPSPISPVPSPTTTISVSLAGGNSNRIVQPGHGLTSPQLAMRAGGTAPAGTHSVAHAQQQHHHNGLVLPPGAVPLPGLANGRLQQASSAPAVHEAVNVGGVDVANLPSHSPAARKALMSVLHSNPSQVAVMAANALQQQQHRGGTGAAAAAASAPEPSALQPPTYGAGGGLMFSPEQQQQQLHRHSNAWSRSGSSSSNGNGGNVNGRSVSLTPQSPPQQQALDNAESQQQQQSVDSMAAQVAGVLLPPVTASSYSLRAGSSSANVVHDNQHNGAAANGWRPPSGAVALTGMASASSVASHHHHQRQQQQPAVVSIALTLSDSLVDQTGDHDDTADQSSMLTDGPVHPLVQSPPPATLSEHDGDRDRSGLSSADLFMLSPAMGLTMAAANSQRQGLQGGGSSRLAASGLGDSGVGQLGDD